METYKDLPVLFFANQLAWQEWLAKNYAEPSGVWIKFAKKASGIPSVSYDQALEDALCYGWIDGQKNSLDESYFLQKFTPRRRKSTWSKRNVGIVARLIEEGRMQPSGQVAIDSAKADGRWDQAYDSPSNMAIPDDLQAALDASPNAKAFYATLNKVNTYAILWRIQTANKPETRTVRIQKLVAMLERGEKIH